MIGEQPNDEAFAHHEEPVPAEVLGAIFKTTPDAFRDIPKNKERVVIARKLRFGQTGNHGG